MMEIRHEERKKKGAFYVEENGERLAELVYFKSAPGEITIYHQRWTKNCAVMESARTLLQPP